MWGMWTPRAYDAPSSWVSIGLSRYRHPLAPYRVHRDLDLPRVWHWDGSIPRPVHGTLSPLAPGIATLSSHDHRYDKSYHPCRYPLLSVGPDGGTPQSLAVGLASHWLTRKAQVQVAYISWSWANKVHTPHEFLSSVVLPKMSRIWGVHFRHVEQTSISLMILDSSEIAMAHRAVYKV